jgi:hypothetical protein
MTNADRREAIQALRMYPRLIKRRGQAKITPDYNGVAVQHGASRVTENVALASSLTEAEERIVNAVEFALQIQAHNHTAAQRLKVTQLVYFRRTHTLIGAAMAVEYNINSVKLWNTELLKDVAAYLKMQKKNSFPERNPVV